MSRFGRAFHIAANTFDRELGGDERFKSIFILAVAFSLGLWIAWLAIGAPRFGLLP
jgi:hypothetical protein